MKAFSLLGVRFSHAEREELLSRAAACVKAARAARSRTEGGRISGGGYIVTPNAEITYRASRDPAFCGILNRATLVLPDGVGVTAAARLFGVQLCRFPGIDFAEALLAVAPPEGYRVFLLGARGGVAVRAAAALAGRYPRVQVVGVYHGYFRAEEDTAVRAQIAAAAPDILFVCLGSPRQEEWMAAHPLPCVAIGLGGALDVWSGSVRRAPRLFRRLGLEWLFRLLSEPRRWRRALLLPRFFVAVVHARFFPLQTDRKKRALHQKNRQM